MLVVASVGAVIFNTNNVNAAQITNRSLTLQAGAGGDGGSLPGGEVNHIFKFDVPSTTSLGSIKFEYCTTASVAACVTPTGLDTTSATLGSEAGSDLTGFSIDTDDVNGSPYLTRTAASPAANDTAILRLDGVINPDSNAGAGETFFVRISTYTSTDTTGSAIDTGSVTAATVRAIELTGTMPESLIFCTGATVTAVGNIPDCSTATSGDITFDQLFSPTDTATANSQMAASTNAAQGYIITVNGETLSSGVNEIDAIGGTAATIAVGTGQFGMNLVENITTFDNTPVTPVELGLDVFPTPDGGDLRGQPLSPFATADEFAFADGLPVAQSNFNTAGPTNGQIFTVSYIVNVPGNQIAGTYTTTLTYICTPTF